MDSYIAVVGDKALEDALGEVQLPVKACPVESPRERIRWVMDLEPSHCLLLLIHDNEGHTSAALSTALDPAIQAMVWSPLPGDATRLLSILQECPVNLNLAPTAQALARQLAVWLQPPSRTGSNERSSSPSATIQTISPAGPVPEPVRSEEDDHLFQMLEKQMAAQIKEVAKPAGPVPIQAPALDFSLPLRKLMSAGDQAAIALHHPEVTGAHYLAQVEEPYLSALARAGLDSDNLNDWLATKLYDSTAAEPVISDEVFTLITQAKKLARQANSSCIRVSDFLQAMFHEPGESVTKALDELEISAGDLEQALTGFHNLNEACQVGFFAPSSLDQDGFYEFNAGELRTIEERLKDLPAFQKAAARVAEGKKPHAGQAAPAKANPEIVQRSAAPPPETPTVLRVESDFPEMDDVEQIADQLLEGQVIAFPNDIMYALGADATNPGAVERLREMAGNDANRKLSLLIHSVTQLKHLVRADLDALEPMLDDLWPGPLTLVFRAAPGVGRHLTSEGTIAVRLPADNLSLAILSMLGRPLAVTSWDKDASTAELSAEELDGVLGMMVKSPVAPAPVTTTIVDLTKTPWEVLREGATSQEEIQRYLPKK